MKTKKLSIALMGLILYACSQPKDIQPMATSNIGFTYLAQGNEPDWSVNVHADNSLTFSTAEIDGIKLVAKRSAYAKGSEYTGTYQNKPFYLKLDGKPCADTMTDKSYDMTAVFEFAGKKHIGCAKQTDF